MNQIYLLKVFDHLMIKMKNYNLKDLKVESKNILIVI